MTLVKMLTGQKGITELDELRSYGSNAKNLRAVEYTIFIDISSYLQLPHMPAI